MAVLLANNAVTTIAAGITDSATSITVATGDGALFPAITGGDHFYATLEDVSNVIEIVKVTARTADVMTVVRAQQGTGVTPDVTGYAYVLGDAFELRLTVDTFTEYVADETAAAGPFIDSTALVKGSADATKLIRLEADGITTATTRVWTAPDRDVIIRHMPAGIGPLPYSGSTIPSGWLACDGTAYDSVASTQYAALYTAIGNTWGGTDGTDFQVPDFRGRVPVGDGTGTNVEDVTSTHAAETLTVVSNDTRWITGMEIVFSTSAADPPDGITEDGTYFLVRVDDTTLELATTLANAQNGTTITWDDDGTGTHTITETLTARTLGEIGGEEAHAMSDTEILLHTHEQNARDGSGSTTALLRHTILTGGVHQVDQTEPVGGNAAMNIMPSFGVVKYIISY